MKVKSKWTILLILLFLVSCAGSQVNQSSSVTVYQSLKTSKTIYDAALKTLAALDYEGKLPKDVKFNIIKAGNVFSIAHNTAVQTLLDGKTPDLNTVSKALDEFLFLASDYYKP